MFDVVGRPETVALGLEQLGHAGTLVYIGLPQPGALASVDLNTLFDRRLRIVVSHGGDHLPSVDFPRLAALGARGTARPRRDGEPSASASTTCRRPSTTCGRGDVIRSVILL